MPITDDSAAVVTDLMAMLKPLHDQYLGYAATADAQSLSKVKKYFRSRSHMKGAAWKSCMFFLVDYGYLTNIPPTPAFDVNLSQPVIQLFNAMLAYEVQCIAKLNDAMNITRAASDGIGHQFVKKLLGTEADLETELQDIVNYFSTVSGDMYAFEKFVADKI